MNPDAPWARQLAEIASDEAGARIGAFFDLDGTLVSGFTAIAHAGHRIRTREANIGEVLGVIEASVRYRLGRMEFGQTTTYDRCPEDRVPFALALAGGVSAGTEGSAQDCAG